ncbi:MAG: hypothetical protein U0610_26180 [bacterium]
MPLLVATSSRHTALAEMIQHDPCQDLAHGGVFLNGGASDLVEDRQIEEDLDPAREARHRTITFLRHPALSRWGSAPSHADES